MKLKEGKDIKSTVCKPYLTPMIFNYSRFEGLLVNIYVKYEDEKEEAIFVLIRNEDDEKYSKVSARLQVLDNYVVELLKVGCYSLFKLSVLNSFKEEFAAILNGKFSRLSQKYKKMIFESNNLMIGEKPDINSKMYKILYRHPLYREALEEELGVKIDEEAELRDKPDLNGRESFRRSEII